MTDNERFDLVIMGGGLAGLTLALQLKRQRPETSILVAEKREGPAPDAAFKVGESTVEIACDYFIRACGLEHHLHTGQLRKAGLRFYFPAGDNGDISQRCEYGDDGYNSVATYQLDRGRFENYLAERCLAHGVEVRGGCRVEAVDLGPDEHTVELSHGGQSETVRGRWVADCAGRSFILKNKLGLAEEVEHDINSAWLRIGNGFVDLEEWGAHNSEWLGRMEAPGIRMSNTCHLLGKGYWVWLIPLATNGHSIGIVADPRFHPFERISTLEAAIDWLREHEPQAARAVEERREDIQDFLKVEGYSHGCSRVFSGERWCMTGESGVFLDPLYSPGSDYIATANWLAGDLIVSELDGQDVSDRADLFDFIFQNQFKSAMRTVWLDQYAGFGDAQMMSAKFTFDALFYFGISCVRTFYDKLTDPDFMQTILPDFMEAFAIAEQAEQLFREWTALGHPENPTGLMTGFRRLPACIDALDDLHAGLDDDALRDRVRRNRDRLAALTVICFHKAAERLPDGGPGLERRINPAAVSLRTEAWDEEGLFDDDKGLTDAEARERLPGIENCLYDELAAQSPAGG